jgi:hypothetical protein
VPRLNRFERMHPDVRTVGNPRETISTYESAGSFLADALDYRDAGRASTLKAVVDWLAAVAGDGDYDAQLASIQRWAVGVNPQEYSALGIRGFGISGFQYLRMLFGANTAKPDVDIRRYVASCVGHRVSDKSTRVLDNMAG